MNEGGQKQSWENRFRNTLNMLKHIDLFDKELHHMSH